MGQWYPEENDGPALQVAAFREEGGRLSTPGPLLRMREDTEINAIVYNRLDQPLTVHGAAWQGPGFTERVYIVSADDLDTSALPVSALLCL